VVPEAYPRNVTVPPWLPETAVKLQVKVALGMPVVVVVMVVDVWDPPTVQGPVGIADAVPAGSVVSVTVTPVTGVE
jgi:hypothetical protein